MFYFSQFVFLNISFLQCRSNIECTTIGLQLYYFNLFSIKSHHGYRVVDRVCRVLYAAAFDALFESSSIARFSVRKKKTIIPRFFLIPFWFMTKMLQTGSPLFVNLNDVGLVANAPIVISKASLKSLIPKVLI